MSIKKDEAELSPPPENIPWYKCFKQCFLSFFDRVYWVLNQPLSIRILVVGPRDGGKTSVIRRYAGDIFYEDKFEPPVDSTFRITSLVKVRRKTRRFNVVIDELPSGMRNYDKLLNKSSAGFLFVYSVDEPDQESEMISVLEKLKAFQFAKDKSNTHKRFPASIMVAGNKSEGSDSTGFVHQANWNSELKNDLEAIGISHFNVSAKNNKGVCEAVNALIEQTATEKIRTVFSRRRGRKVSRRKSNNCALLGEEENDAILGE